MPKLNARKIAKALGAKRMGKVSTKGGVPGAHALAAWVRNQSNWRGEHGNGIVPMPAGYEIYNGCNEACDAAAGPCSCGAWHQRADWLWRASQKQYSKKEKSMFKRLVKDVDRNFT